MYAGTKNTDATFYPVMRKPLLESRACYAKDKYRHAVLSINFDVRSRYSAGKTLYRSNSATYDAIRGPADEVLLHAFNKLSVKL